MSHSNALLDSSAMDVDSNGKKRKAGDAATSKAPPAKRAAAAAGNGAAKKEPGRTTKAEATGGAAAAKSDSSFFSAPKKKVLPSFKKVASTAAKADVSQPSNIDPFQEALNAMTKGAGAAANATSSTSAGKSSIVAGTNGASSSSDGMMLDGTTSYNGVSSSTKPSDPLKRKKSVVFASDDQLEAIRWIERAEYDDEEDEVRTLYLPSRVGNEVNSTLPTVLVPSRFGRCKGSRPRRRSGVNAPRVRGVDRLV